MLALTGATGFVGQTVHAAMLERGLAVRGLSREPSHGLVAVGDIGPHTDWAPHLQGVRAVVHLGARVHVLNDTATDPLAEFRRVNVEGTANLARQAAKSGVRRFVFVSSIKVNGERTPEGCPFTADDMPAPEDPYGLSKLEGEAALRQVAADTGLEVAIVRPPLVYGPGVKGNFLSMMQLVSRGLPIPLGAVDNRRSLVAVGNLADLILRCVDHPAAAGGTFLVSDGKDMSTADLLRRLGMALGKPARLIPVPVSLLNLGAAAIGKGAVARRLLESLQVDMTKTKSTLEWSPPVGVDETLERTARHFRQTSTR